MTDEGTDQRQDNPQACGLPESAEQAFPQYHVPHYVHTHGPVPNANRIALALQGFGARAADSVAATVGSWPFVLIQSVFLVGWIVVNVTAAIKRWDPYPFILLNLVLSFQAAYTAPIIMMSQNRQVAKDRVEAEADYQTNLRSEEEIKAVLERLEATNDAVLELLRRQTAFEEYVTQVLTHLGEENPAVAQALSKTCRMP